VAEADTGPAIPHSYVHAKTWIFDDRFAIIGSANCNQRGWTHDSESCVGTFDESKDTPGTYTFAHRLRIRLWAWSATTQMAERTPSPATASPCLPQIPPGGSR